MILDLPASSFSHPANEDDEDHHPSDDEERGRHDGKLHIKPILQLVLQDAQTRLLFKAQAVMESEIRVYKAKPEDLAYPDKIVGEFLVEF